MDFDLFGRLFKPSKSSKNISYHKLILLSIYGKIYFSSFSSIKNTESKSSLVWKSKAENRLLTDEIKPKDWKVEFCLKGDVGHRD